MTGRSSRGRWQRVLDARARARAAQGVDPNQQDLFDSPLPKKSKSYVPLSAPPAERRPDESVPVLTLGEAAARLGISRGELEALIAAGKIEALPTGYTRMIPVLLREGLAMARGARVHASPCGYALPAASRASSAA